jgi:hypothetical protein
MGWCNMLDTNNIMRIDFEHLGVKKVALFNINKISEDKVRNWIKGMYPISYNENIIFITNGQFENVFSEIGEI